ncbi:alanine racemase [Mariprofundus ferrooxydans]|nr:alanine racemase [Mariprofundus ferrooxydans]
MAEPLKFDSRPAVARINLHHLRHNYAVLKQRSGSANIMAVVKANAYGHGMTEVARTLFDAGCQSFGVTDACEGFALRQTLPPQSNIHKSNTTDIILLSGLFNSDNAKLAVSAALTPVITTMQHIDWLQAAGFHRGVWIKIDSGMNRIGASDPPQLITRCKQAGINICGLMSHLACADEPDHPMNQRQLETFTQACDQTAIDLPRSLLNSAGIACMPEHAMQLVRPGIALYGIEPIPTMPMGLKPVMSLMGGIIQLSDIAAGDPVSYGASFLAPQAMRIATVGLGYADGVPRGLSNTGSVYIHGQTCPIIGRVCMDYTMIDVSRFDHAQDKITLGESVEFWGEHISANTVAEQLHSISYTLFTGIGNRVQRIEVR